MDQAKLYWPLEKVKNWDKNPRGIKKEDFARLKKQISELGQYKPLIVNSGKYWGKEGEIAGGNMRFKAYQEMGIKEVWVSIVDPKDEAEFFKYALSDNDRAGYYLEEQTAQLVTEFGVKISLDDYKLDLGESITLTDLLNRLGPELEEDEAPEVSEGEPISKQGEIYQLGKHRLMCGDATRTEDVEKLMNGQKADMIFTDPPYGINYDTDTRPSGKPLKSLGKVGNDNLSDTEFRTLLSDSIANMLAYSKDEVSCYICFHGKTYHILAEVLSALDFHVSSRIVWIKNQFILGRTDYHTQWEFIIYGWKSNQKHNFYGDRKQSDVWEVHQEAHGTYLHPTMKPLALCGRAIKNNSKQNDTILDLFGGSGSTLIACEQLNRICYMMELDPRYCDVIRKRYEAFTEKRQKE